MCCVVCVCVCVCVCEREREREREHRGNGKSCSRSRWARVKCRSEGRSVFWSRRLMVRVWTGNVGHSVMNRNTVCVCVCLSVSVFVRACVES